MPHRLKVFLVADKPVIRDGLARGDRPGYRDLVLCGQAADAAEARQRISASPPNVGDRRSDAPQRQRAGPVAAPEGRTTPGCRSWVPPSAGRTRYAERPLRAGARGYLMQQEPSENVATAICRVHGGHVYLSESMRSHLWTTFARPTAATGRASSSSPTASWRSSASRARACGRARLPPASI